MTKPEKEIRDIKKHLQGINDNIEKILYLERWKTDREQSNLLSSGFIDVMSGVDNVLQWVLLEIKYLKSLPKQDPKPKDEPWYESYFNVTYLDFEDIWNSDEYHVNNINLDKKYGIPDPKMIIKPHTQEEFEEYHKLMDEMKELVREEISQRLQSNISGTLKFLEHHLEKYQGDSVFVLHDPDEVKNQSFRDSFNANHGDTKVIIGYPEYKENPDFMEFYNENRAKKVNKKPFLLFIQEMLPNFPEISEARKNTIIEWVEEKLKDIKNNITPIQANERIKWQGTPSQFGHLMLELVKQGFVGTKLHNGETNFSALARLCFNCFEIETTIGNLTKELNPEKNTLSDTKRAKFTIPNLSDLA